MTENEAKLFNNLMEHNSAYYGYELSKGEIKTVLQAFEQLKQYRAIGTVEEIRSMIRKSDFTPKPSKEELIAKLKELSKIKMMLECFEAIGTVEEFKALKDKGVAKKPKSNKVIFSGDSYAYCPHCKGGIEAEFMKPRNCRKCGGELDWS